MLTYEPTIESLRRYRVPEWYRDAKLGIYTHWGPYSVPAFGDEWYPRNMYDKSHDCHRHHRGVWGEPSEFGYKDFIPMFRAEAWDPERWADLFVRAGAKFAGPVIEHHDGFAMYDCSFTPYTSVKMGPRRDVTLESKEAFEAAGLRFIATSHRARNARHFPSLPGSDRNDPAYRDLYGDVFEDKDAPVDEAFLKDWLGRTKEAIDLYTPDVLWFDFGWHRPEFLPYRLDLVAYFYNQAEQRGQEVVMNYKDDVFDGAAVYNVERGKLAGIRPDSWQTDTSISTKSWSFIENENLKSPTRVVHDLVDIVSKNGNMLLNVGPRPDGTIPPEAEGILLALGDWLAVNGEAIYSSRVWHRFGEGPTAVEAGHFSERKDQDFTPRDVRYTTKPNTLYAICLGWPGRTARLRALATGTGLGPDNIRSVRMLGVDGPLDWRQDHEALHVGLPDRRPCDHAYALALDLKEAPAC
ncbi:MAG: alpha-L-fucosidase [Planctomycetota bacterium]